MSPSRPRTSEHWIEYFRHNDRNLREIPWQAGVRLSFAVLNSVSASVQEFQLGESSEGRTFAKMATDYARVSGDDGYIVAQGLFVAEEHRHARDLGRFMDLAGIPRVQKTVADGIFRRLRKRHPAEEFGRDRAVAHRAATLASGSDVTGAPASSRGATKL